MISAIGAFLGILLVILKALWQRRTERHALENDPEEQIRRLQRAATAGNEADVQAQITAWRLRGRTCHGGNCGVRLYRPPPAGDRGPESDGAA